MPYIEANGIRLHVQQMNPECENTVILIHGLLVGSLAMWYFTAAPVLSESCRVIMYDLRSHGKSEKIANGFDIPSMVRDLEAVVDYFQLNTVSIVGHSFGGIVALNYALKHPESIHKLGIIDSPLPLSDMAEMNLFMKQSPAEMVHSLPEWLQALVCSGKRQAMKLMQSLEYLAFRSTLFSDLQNEPDLENELLNSLNIPTLLLYGKRSLCINSGLRLSREIPDSSFITMSGGHYLPMECSEDVNHCLREFFCG